MIRVFNTILWAVFFTGLDAAQILRTIKADFMEGAWYVSHDTKERMAREAGVKIRLITKWPINQR